MNASLNPTFGRVHGFALASLFALTVPSALTAAALYWDTNGDGVDATYGGSGTWDGANTYWNTSATIGSGTLQAWTGGSADSANFLRNTTGTVTVSGSQTVSGLTLGSSTGSFTTGSGTAYTLDGGTIDIRAASFAFTLNNNAGTNIINSAISLLGGATAGVTNQQRININGGTLTLGAIQDISGVTGTHNLSLEAYSGGTLNLSGNITKSAGSSGITLLIGGTGTSNTVFYSLGGNNTGLTATGNTFNRGTLTLNSSTALAGAGTLTVANANTGTGSPDTANLYIGTAGVSISNAITISTLGTDTTDIRTLGGSHTTGTSTYSGTITVGAFAASGTGSSLRVEAATGGTTVFSGAITDGAATVAVTKTGGGIVQFTRASGNTYDGGTTVSTGSLIVGNTSGSATGTGALSVSSGATFGGLNTGSANAGIVSGATTFAAGSFLSPGAGSGTANTLTFGSTLDVSGLASDTGGLLFQIGTVGDQVALTSGALTIGSGVLNFDDFAFTTLSGFGAGTYTLLDTSTSIIGTLGTNLTGTLGGLNATLSLANAGQDIVLTVTAIPEPSTYAVLLAGLALASILLRRDRNARRFR